MGQVSSQRKLTQADIEFIKSNTSYDEETIKKWWNQFRKECPNGKMTPKQMASMCQMVYPDLDVGELGKHMGRVFDTDASGYVDFKEFLVGINKNAQGTEKEQIQNVFKMFDVDGNDVIDVTEMIKILKASVNVVFHIDENKDVEEEARKLFKKMDKDKDGFVTKEEFVKATEGVSK